MWRVCRVAPEPDLLTGAPARASPAQSLAVPAAERPGEATATARDVLVYPWITSTRLRSHTQLLSRTISSRSRNCLILDFLEWIVERELCGAVARSSVSCDSQQLLSLEDAMAKYLITGSYTTDGTKGLLVEGGSARKAAVEKALQ